MPVISKSRLPLLRLWRFYHRPWHEKAIWFRSQWVSLLEGWKRMVSSIVRPIRLPFGAWWLARNDHISRPLQRGFFETVEVGFVERLLQPGMTVLDIGAHHGLYTLLASKRVGPKGRVISFEPSPRERRALMTHVLLNRCRNVIVEGVAVGDEDGSGSLYIAESSASGGNSLRPLNLASKAYPISVRVTELDNWLEARQIERVDFIKLDVEGGELGVLRGATHLLERLPRPVILVEVQDVRTEPWGYRAREILVYLGKRGYKWFSLSGDGSIMQLDTSASHFEGNFVAWPEESLERLHRFESSAA